LANLRGGPDNITLQIIHIGSGEKAPEVKGPSLWQRIPWSIKALCVGTVFAASAIALSFNRVPGGGFLFAIASIIIISSLIGLILQVHSKKKKKSDDSNHPPPQIYRSSTCQIEKPLLEKLIRANQAVKDHALEKQWDVDWDGYHVQQEFADSLRHQGDLDS